MSKKTLTTEIRTELSNLVGKNVHVEGIIKFQKSIRTGRFNVVLSPVKVNGIETDHVNIFFKGVMKHEFLGRKLEFTSRVIRYSKNSTKTFAKLYDYSVNSPRYKDYENAILLDEDGCEVEESQEVIEQETEVIEQKETKSETVEIGGYEYSLDGKDEILQDSPLIIRYGNKIGSVKELVKAHGLTIRYADVYENIRAKLPISECFTKHCFSEVKESKTTSSIKSNLVNIKFKDGEVNFNLDDFNQAEVIVDMTTQRIVFRKL